MLSLLLVYFLFCIATFTCPYVHDTILNSDYMSTTHKMEKDPQQQIIELRKQVKALTEALDETRNNLANVEKMRQSEEDATIKQKVFSQVAAHLDKFLQDLQLQIDKALVRIRAAVATSQQAAQPHDIIGGSAQPSNQDTVTASTIPSAKYDAQNYPVSASNVGVESGSKTSNITCE